MDNTICEVVPALDFTSTGEAEEAEEAERRLQQMLEQHSEVLISRGHPQVTFLIKLADVSNQYFDKI